MTPDQALEDLASLKEMIHAQKTSYTLKKYIYAVPKLANQAKVKNMMLPIGCAICPWIAGTSGLA
jgi:hypothetical protein